MWTDEHRATYRRVGLGFPSDLTDGEWGVLQPLIPDATPGGRPRYTDMRSAMNAILYLLRTGCLGALVRMISCRRPGFHRHWEGQRHPRYRPTC